MRYFLELAYRGTHYAGWQAQPNAHTVQAEIEGALQILFRREVPLVGAGRTDTGVHASQLFAHFEAAEPLPPALVNSLNGILPMDVAIHGLYRPTKPDLHARFDALSRAYTYQVVLRKSPLHTHTSMWVRQALDVHAMNEAASLLLNYEDFASFCKAHADNKTTLCRMDQAYWKQPEPYVLHFHVQANRFLRGMVRALVGSLVWVGRGKISLADFQAMIEAKDRKAAGPNAPAAGLTLTQVAYPEGALIPIHQR